MHAQSTHAQDQGGQDAVPDDPVQSQPAALTLPPALKENLERLRPILERHGTLLWRRERGRRETFRLRFRAEDADGHRVHRAFSLGSDPFVAGRVWDMIEGWRGEHQARQAAAQKEQEDRRAEARMWREHKRQLVANVSGGPRQKRRLAQMIEQARRGGVVDFVTILGCEDLCRKLSFLDRVSIVSITRSV